MHPEVRGSHEIFSQPLKRAEETFTEKELLDGLVQGVPEVVVHLQRRVRAGIRAIVKPWCDWKLLEQDLDDLLADVTAQTFINITGGYYKDVGKLIPYMIAMGRNKYLAQRERAIRQAKQKDHVCYWLEQLAEMSTTEMLDVISAAMSILDPHCRQLLQMSVIDKRPLAEVAAETAHTYDGVKQKKRVCLDRLGKLVAELKRKQAHDEGWPT